MREMSDPNNLLERKIIRRKGSFKLQENIIGEKQEMNFLVFFSFSNPTGIKEPQGDAS